MSSDNYEGTAAGTLDGDASVGNEEEGGTVASSGGGDGGGGSLALLSPSEPGAFLAAARGLLAGAGSSVFVIDVQASSGAVLRASHPGAAPGAASFDIPVAAVETVTPLGIDGGSPRWLLAAVAFRAGFESLAGTFARIGAGGAPAGGVEEGPVEGAVRAAGPDDDDPASPEASEVSEVADLATARTLANVGSGAGATEAFDLEAPRPETETATPPTMPLDITVCRRFLDACTSSNPRVTYGLGAKVPSLGARPGKDFTKVDCSGFVREAIRLATTPRLPFPDGSVVQHEFVRKQKYRKSSVEAAFKTDGAVRIAFLRPQDVKSGIGHVVLIHNAMTLESHGGTGPNSRPWNGQGWQAKAFVYRLTDPPA